MSCEFEPHVGLCAVSSEPGFCVSLCLCPSPACALCLVCLSKIKAKKKIKKKREKLVPFDQYPPISLTSSPWQPPFYSLELLLIILKIFIVFFNHLTVIMNTDKKALDSIHF